MGKPLFIDDTPSLTITQLRAKARRLKQSEDIGVIFIDYLQLMTSGSRVESRQQEVSDISRGVKALARELEVPIVCLSQLNRAAEQREGHRPRMSDLRESGSIEQDADVVIFLYRPWVYTQDDEDEGKADVIVAKQRNGPTGSIKASFISKYAKFENLSQAESPF